MKTILFAILIAGMVFLSGCTENNNTNTTNNTTNKSNLQIDMIQQAECYDTYLFSPDNNSETWHGHFCYYTDNFCDNTKNYVKISNGKYEKYKFMSDKKLNNNTLIFIGCYDNPKVLKF